MPPPLITFPPSTFTNPHYNQTSHSTIKPRSTFNRICSALPLLFIALILSFTLYSFLISLTLSYLLLDQGEWFRSLIYSILFLWFWSGCFGSLIQSVLRGGGHPALMRGSRRDEESFVNGERDSQIVVEGEEEDDALLTNNGEAEEGTMSIYNEQVKSKIKPLRTSGLQLKANGKQRFCTKCQLPKSDRSHHCSICRICTYKMDHHCPWLGGGCVGHQNYKFFLLFLWYSSALGLFCASATMWELSRFVAAGPDNFELAPLLWSVTLLLGFIFGLSLGLFGAYHFYLACNNRTTIEAMERTPTYAIDPSKPHSRSSRYKPDHALTRVERRRLARAASKLHIYDLGVAKNLAQIFGGWESKWIWILPMGYPPGDGTTFPINRENLEKLTRITEEIRRAGDSGSDTESEGVAEQTLNDLEESGEDADDDGWDTRTVRGREIES